MDFRKYKIHRFGLLDFRICKAIDDLGTGMYCFKFDNSTLRIPCKLNGVIHNLEITNSKIVDVDWSRATLREVHLTNTELINVKFPPRRRIVNSELPDDAVYADDDGVTHATSDHAGYSRSANAFLPHGLFIKRNAILRDVTIGVNGCLYSGSFKYRR